jgi:isopentenyl-diphosphate delta-isomerase
MEKVVLLNEKLEPIGEADKAGVHTLNTPLHLAFSCFLFNSGGELLVQQRALSKITWPGVWSNSCCGHPLPSEDMKDAVYRRLKFELGYDRSEVEMVEAIADFRYKAEFKGVVENEFCPVWIGKTDKVPVINTSEVNEFAYLNWKEFIDCIRDNNCTKFNHFSIWCREEALILDEKGIIEELLK